jgi:Cu-Zn family superoxide dismutase
MNRNAFILCASVLSICLLGGSAAATGAAASKEQQQVTVKLVNTKGEQVGTALIVSEAGGVSLHVEAKNLTPGLHGIHFHETGKCEPPDFTSAGAHLNPQHKQHGFKNPKGFHAGDLPNIQVGPDGTVTADLATKMVTLTRDAANSLLRPGGTALVIHEKADDYMTDPAGNSGARIACGAIQ